MYVEQGLTRPFYLEQKHTRVEEDDSNLIVVQNSPNWTLCDTSEERLKQAMKDSGVLLVNEKLLVKFFGKMSGLCLKDFTTRSGSYFQQGFWYAPQDDNTRRQICANFDEGFQKLEIDGGSWIRIRDINANKDHKKLLEKAIRVGRGLETTHRGKLNTPEKRIHYRLSKEEGNRSEESA